MQLQISLVQQIQLLIEDLYIQDQNAWASKNSLEEVYKVINRRIKELLSHIIDKVGFIHPDEYGLKTAEYFYTLIVHADYFKDLQKEYLSWLRNEELLKTLDKYNLEKRILELQDPINLTNQEFLHLQKKWFGKPIQPMSYFKRYDFIRPFYTTTTLGNLSFRYGEFDEVVKNRQAMLQKLNKLGNVKEKIAPHDFAFATLKSKDNIAYWPNVLQEAGVSPLDYNFETITVKELESIGLDIDAIIFPDFKNVKAGGFVVGDCYVLLMFAPKQNVGALVHIGTPGLSLDLIGKVVDRLQKEFNVKPEELYVIMGPGILKDHYIYEDISRYKNNPYVKNFLIPVKNMKNYVRRSEGGQSFDADNVAQDYQKYHVDLFGGIRNRLLQLGIPFDNYRITPLDTYTSKFLYSHVRSLKEGDSEGRFMVGFVNEG